MNMKEIGAIGYPVGYGSESRGKIISDTKYMEKKEEKICQQRPACQMPLMDLYNMMKKEKKISNPKEADVQKEEVEKNIEGEKDNSKTDADIIVKPDGSRVLVVTMSIGGMETTMSLEISKPTEMPNESREEYNGDSGQDMENGALTGGVGDSASEI